jgi:hypothetical protein
MFARLVLAFFLICGSAAAQQLENNQPRIEQPTAKDSANKGQEQKPEASPQTIIVKVAAPEKTDEDRQHEAEDRKQKSELDSKLTEYTGELASFTKGLFFATVVLAIATIALVVLAGFQSKDMKASIAAAQDSASASMRAANIAENSFIRLERPYIYIYGVHRFVAGAENAVVEYTVANFGKTPARVTVLAAGISFASEPLDNLIVDYRDDPEHPLLVEPVLAPADMHQRLYLKPPDNLDFGHGQTDTGNFLPVAPRLKPDEYAFVWIQVSYRGPAGDGYMTSACWRYDGLTDRLVEWGGEKYNYMI